MQKKKGKILIIDDDEDVLITAKMILRNHFEHILLANSPKQLPKMLKDDELMLIILDMNFKTGATTGNEGLFWLREIKKSNPKIPVIMNTAYGDIQLAVACMKEGAKDFLVKPWEKEKLLTTVINIYDLYQSNKKIHRLEESKQVLKQDMEHSLGELIGDSPAMQKVYDTIKKVAQTEANVLILGENGTGKELVARAIHNLSDRKNKDFIKVDLGALASTLFESELFGHVKGAFTDAKANKTGRFQLAEEGTLFLDEIGNISLTHQAKLLSALQNRQVTPVGASQPVSTNIRLITATNKAVQPMVEEDTFREDLLYRINTITINLPPLRKRQGDIQLLFEHFLKIYVDKYHKPNIKFNPKLEQQLENYQWPGNVRELQHAVERAVILSENGHINPEDLIPRHTEQHTVTPQTLNVRSIEKDAILKAIEKCDHNLSQAAQTLGMGRSTLYRKMEKYNIKP